jgi:DNA-binding transcriptional regulator YhcF (GntR family)
MIIEINPASTVPIYEQLREQVILGIASGKLSPGEVLPSVRNLGADLGINFHTVNKAYAMLHDEGYIIMNRRLGAVVATDIPGGGEHMVKLTARIQLAAAEAACRGLDENAFLALCGKCYQSAANKMKNGGAS